MTRRELNSPEPEQRWRFARLWAATVASNLGDGVVLAAFPLLAAGITDDPVAISSIAVAAGLPWLVVGPVAGSIVDRFDRRRLMIGFDIARAAAVAAFAVAVLADAETLWMLYAVVFAITIGETVVDTSSQSLLPSLVPKDRLDRSNGVLFSTMTVAHRFVGPPLGGYLFGLAAALPVILDSASFAVAAVLMLTLTGRFRPDTGATHQREPLRTSIAEGMAWLWANRPIRAFAIGAGMINVGVVAGEAILVLFATDQLALGGAGFGALFAATALGYTSGSAVTPWVTKRVDRRRIVVSSVAAIVAALLTIGLSEHWIQAAGGLFITGFASGLWDVIAVSYRQAAVPDRLRGRIMAAYRVIAHGSVPIGALLGGFAARIGGNRAAFLVGAVVVAAALPYVAASLRGDALDPSAAAGD